MRLSDFPAVYRTMHFVGVGGIGMSGLARLYLERGCRVRGTDVKRGPVCGALESSGAEIFIGHDAAHVRGADVLVYSSSIPKDHPERAEAKRLGIPELHRSEALRILCDGKFTVAISGTHGKTTTTSMTAMALTGAGKDPTVVVGGWVAELGGNAKPGSGREIVIEADESDASFLNFTPDIAVITNIEAEHLDHYRTVEAMERAFSDFLSRVPGQGAWVGCAEDDRVMELDRRRKASRLYGWQRMAGHLSADAIEVSPGNIRGSAFDVWDGMERLGRVRLAVPGRHNILNALAAIAVGLLLDVPFEAMAEALSRFKGAGRRFDVKFENEDFLVVDDYAHHPTEIEKTLAAARSVGRNRIVALFQPHRYSRTESLMEWFGRSFAGADKLFLTDIYAASEAPRPGVSGRALYETVCRAGHPDAHFVSREALADRIRQEARPGDLVLVMGAGDISQVASQLSECLRKIGRFDGIFSAVRGRVLKEESLSRHTTLKIGGPAEFWIEPEDLEDLRTALSVAATHGLRVTVFGAGSNVLPPDEGLRGVVLHLGAAYFKEMRFEQGRWTARAGVPNSLFIQFGMEQGLGGFEFLSGIPGNIGGAIAMNAGSHGQWIGPFIKEITTVDEEGRVRRREASELSFGYRRSGLGREIVVEAAFSFPSAPREKTQGTLDRYRDHRMATQDLHHPSAGCMFKNPDIPGCSSGRLIDEAGLKGFRKGGAQVSEKHANFIINAGGAKASDVRELIEAVRQKVKERHGIDLETEVKIL